MKRHVILKKSGFLGHRKIRKYRYRELPNRRDVFVNVNTHEISIDEGKGDGIITYKKYDVRPKIIFEMRKDPRAPDAGVLYVADITNMPPPVDGIKYISNRDTLAGVRKIENRMKLLPEYENTFRLLKEYPDSWRVKLTDEIKKGTISEHVYSRSLLFVDRHDLRAPGIQVRDINSKVTHCVGLISEF